jgi:hypothetical protein
MAQSGSTNYVFAALRALGLFVFPLGGLLGFL